MVKKVLRVTSVIFATIGVLFIVLFISGFVADFKSFDRTSGGYEPPYENYTGEPINWNDGDTSTAGFVRRGSVLNTLLNCTSGMISFQIYGNEIEFRKVSERAIKVHKPREACIAKGFSPEF
ncbi:MAG: hypothetical protein ACNYPH_03945 [Gammaproteobacteria bacterium WSBS_2016_MAG_OTU1]